MIVTMEGMLFLSKLLALSGLVGFFFTFGVWGFCKAVGWAPVNLTINNHIRDDQ